MTDPRPSENTDDCRWESEHKDTRPFAAVAEYGRTYLGWEDRTETPVDDEQDPIADLIERAENAHDHTLGLVFAQLATVRAMQAQTEQARIANLIALGQYRVAPDDLPPFRSYLMEPVGTFEVRPVEEIRKGLNL